MLVNDLDCAMCNTQQRAQPPLALAVPLSRFTSRVGGGSAFYVRLLERYAHRNHNTEPLLASSGGIWTFSRDGFPFAAGRTFVAFQLFILRTAAHISLRGSRRSWHR